MFILYTPNTCNNNKLILHFIINTFAIFLLNSGIYTFVNSISLFFCLQYFHQVNICSEFWDCPLVKGSLDAVQIMINRTQYGYATSIAIAS